MSPAATAPAPTQLNGLKSTVANGGPNGTTHTDGSSAASSSGSSSGSPPRPEVLARLHGSLATIKHGSNVIFANSYASPSPSGATTPVPFIDLSALQTEGRNAKTRDIDVVSTEEMCGKCSRPSRLHSPC